jgi:hypothetical protein
VGDNLDRMRKAAGQAVRGQPPAPPLVRVTHRCGHSFTPFEVAQHDCVACHRKNQQKRRREHLDRKRKQPDPTHLRLPLGSVKTLVWSEVDGVLAWRGTLAVPGVPPFLQTADSEKACFHGLHRQYVAWLAANTGGADDA